MAKIQLDDQVYDTEELNERSRRITAQLQDVNNRIKELNNLVAILRKAKYAYVADLKTEMLSAKAGFDFESNE